jgi:hypothetical protein
MHLLHSRSLARASDALNGPPSPTSPTLLPLAKSEKAKKKVRSSTDIKWHNLGSYETHSDALRSRKVIKSLVISDSNGTIQIDPRTDFHDLSLGIAAAAGAGASNGSAGNVADEENPTLIVGRMSTSADRGVAKIVIRKNLSKMQWTVETDDAEVEKIVRRHRRKRGVDGTNEEVIPVRTVKRLEMKNGRKGTILEPLSPQRDILPFFPEEPVKGFGNMTDFGRLEKKQREQARVNVVKENIEKYSAAIDAARVRDESPRRPKVDEVNDRLLKLKRLLLNSTYPESGRDGRAGIKLPPLL